jgi:hypothetical protein
MVSTGNSPVIGSLHSTSGCRLGRIGREGRDEIGACGRFGEEIVQDGKRDGYWEKSFLPFSSSTIFSLVSHGKKTSNDVEMLGLLSDAGAEIYHREKLCLSPGVRWRQR